MAVISQYRPNTDCKRSINFGAAISTDIISCRKKETVVAFMDCRAEHRQQNLCICVFVAYQVQQVVLKVFVASMTAIAEMAIVKAAAAAADAGRDGCISNRDGLYLAIVAMHSCNR